MALKIAVQRVQLPSRSVHVGRSLCPAQLKELDRPFGGMRRLNPSFAPGGEKLLDPTMPEALDHVYSVALHFSLVKREALNANRAEGICPLT
jgi:hypothetical protein